MTKNAGAKKAVRRLAREKNVSNTAARRLLRETDPTVRADARPDAIAVRYEFTGLEAPEPIRFDAARVRRPGSVHQQNPRS
jgi:hypothetical protein